MGRTYFHEELCKGCGLCVEACPKHILSLAEDRLNQKGYQPAACREPEACTGCAVCARTCPDVAIMVWREAAGARASAATG